MAFTEPIAQEPKPTEPSVCIGVRLRSSISFNNLWISLINMDKSKAKTLVPAEGYGAAESARYLFRKFLKETQCTHILMLDDDAVLADQTLNRLLSRNLPVVAALTWTHGLPPLPTIWRGLSNVDGGYPSWWVRQDEIAKWFEDPRIAAEINQHKGESAFVLSCTDRDFLKRTDVIGLHCTLFRRDVIEAIGEPFLQGDENGVREDFDLSQRVAHLGHDIFVDTSAVVGHTLAHPIRPFDYFCYEFYKENGDKPKGG